MNNIWIAIRLDSFFAYFINISIRLDLTMKYGDATSKKMEDLTSNEGT